MRRDFRTEAAEATLSKLRSLGANSVADLDESGCVFIEGGRGLRYAVEVPNFLIIIGCWILFLVAMLLGLLGIVSERAAAVVLLVGFAMALVVRKVRSILLKVFLSQRSDGLIKNFPELPTRAVAIEEGKTVQKIKFLTEDEGVCLLDGKQQRLLIEGCSFRHVIWAKDVLSVEAISGYALSGARLVCRMGGHEIDMGIKSAGQGPLASLVQAFVPSAQATGLATILNRTLFGTETPVYKQNAVPPLLSRGM
jgi:hypothetical protein